jgi:hypothetical protein
VQPQFEQTGGLRWTIATGVTVNATWPFASITVSAEQIQVTVSVLGLYRRNFAFPAHTIETVRPRWGFLSSGVQLLHSVPDYPALIVFWTFGYRSLVAALREYGYHVEDDTKA